MTRVIKIEKGVSYLNDSTIFNKEFKGDLPKNVLFDKGSTGCGGTTMAINSGLPYVVAVPYVSLINNKKEQHPHIICVKAGVTVDEIKAQVRNRIVTHKQAPIIFTTYDGLSKVVRAIPTHHYRLLIDEYHMLFNAYAYRREAIQGVFDHYNKFESYTFMSATPIEDEFVLTELQDLYKVKLVWQDVSEVKVHIKKCSGGRAADPVFNALVELINYYLNGDIDKNAYIFINSVSTIKQLTETIPQLTEANCNLIYGASNPTRMRLDRGELPILKDASIKPRKINLITSTMFEGGDIYDENGVTYIASEGKLACSLIDISTSIRQIIGRIRNSKYIGEVTHFYSNSRYLDIPYADFKKVSEQTIDEATILVKDLNQMSILLRDKVSEVDNAYIVKTKENYWNFDSNLVKIDIHNYKMINEVYKARVNNVTKEYKNNNIMTNFSNYRAANATTVSMPVTFIDTVKKLKEIYGGTYSIIGFIAEENEEFVNAAFIKYRFLKEALHILNFSGIEALKYNQTNIKRKVINTLSINNYSKINKMLKAQPGFRSGAFVSNEQIVRALTNIMMEMNIKGKVSPSDINNYFITKSHRKRVNGVVQRGYLLYTPKMINK